MAWRRLAAVLLLASASAAVLAQDQAPSYLPEPQTTCYDCHHDAAYGSSPPVDTFLAITPAEDAGAAIGQPFDYAIRIQNAWTANLTYIEPRLDLTNAPSLGFAADLPPIESILHDNLTVDARRATEAQAKPNVIDVPVGLTYLQLRLEPNDRDPVTGPDLALRIEAGSFSQTIDRNGRGQPEELVLETRGDFSPFGYGNWTVSAVLTPVRSDDLLNFTVPKQTIPFQLQLHAGASETAERIVGLASRDQLGRAAGMVAVFRLVPLALPQPGETVGLEVRAHIQYDHPPSANAKDDADLFKPYLEPINVVATGDEVHLTTTTPQTVAVRVQNGATMATVAEAVGYASAFLLVGSTTAGGMFGKASRRWANGVFGTARRRVAFHNFLSYGLILAAFAHVALFLIEAAYAWAVGLVWGGLAALCMLGLGFTGALQVPIIRRWDYGTWRWTHFGLTIGTVAFTLVHMGLDGAHFEAVQDWLGWRDPVVRAFD